jgi:hypothetical protein
VAYFRRREEPVLRTRVWFGPGAEGPPGLEHGGSVAAVLDEALGGGAWMLGRRVVVAQLIVDFRMVALGHAGSDRGGDRAPKDHLPRGPDPDTVLAEAEG